jgi:hypothetical protein
MASVLRNPNTLGVLSITNLLGLAGNTFLLRSHMKELSEDHEARMVCYSLTLLFLVISIVWATWSQNLSHLLRHEMDLLVRFSTEVKWLSLSISFA